MGEGPILLFPNSGRMERFGERSSIERWFGVFKRRAKLLWKR